MWMITKLLSQSVSKISLLLFPVNCYLCKSDTDQLPLCKPCSKTLTKSIETPAPFIISLYSFRDHRIKRIVHATKYFHRKDLIVPLAKIVAQEIPQVKNRDYMLVPIPMPKLRKLLRGYNHAEVLAQFVGKELNLPVKSHYLSYSGPVTKRRQVATHSRHERLINRKNTFLAHPDVQHKDIILLDDVTTTGATLIEARKVLLEKGASSVSAYTIAH